MGLFGSGAAMIARGNLPEPPPPPPATAVLATADTAAPLRAVGATAKSMVAAAPLEAAVLPSRPWESEAPPPVEVMSAPASWSYRATDLTAGLPAGHVLEVRAINNRGDAAAVLVRPGMNGERPQREAVVVRAGGQFEHYPPPDGFHRLSLTDINDRGQAVGTLVRFERGKVPLVHLALVEKGVVRDLGTLGVEPTRDARGEMRPATINEFAPYIDEKGRIVALVGGRVRRWSPGGAPVEDLGSGYVTDVSPAGLIAGSKPVGEDQMGIWIGDHLFPPLKGPDAASSFEAPSSSHPSSNRSVAEAVNDHGLAVIATEVSGSSFPPRRLTLYFLWDGKQRAHIALLRGLQSRTRINRRGEVVGFGNHSGNGRMAPYLFRDGALYDLREIVRRGSDWNVEAVTALNDRGQMVVLAWHQNQELRPVLLTPVDFEAAPSSEVRNAAPDAPSPQEGERALPSESAATVSPASV
jgi:hypothetical protein